MCNHLVPRETGKEVRSEKGWRKEEIGRTSRLHQKRSVGAHQLLKGCKSLLKGNDEYFNEVRPPFVSALFFQVWVRS